MYLYFYLRTRSLNNPRFSPEVLIPLQVALVLGIQSISSVPRFSIKPG